MNSKGQTIQLKPVSLSTQYSISHSAYAMFAAWLTKQHRDTAIKAKKSIVFKVNGATTIDNGNL